MKKYLALILVFALFACNKSSNKLYLGNFTYKLSGSIELEEIEPQRADSSDGEDPIPFVPRTLTLRIVAETGQLNMLAEDTGSDKRIITTSAVGGDVAIGEGWVNADNTLDIKINNKSLSANISDSRTQVFNTDIIGAGQRIDDTLIIYFLAIGEINYMGVNYKVTNSSLECVARINDL